MGLIIEDREVARVTTIIVNLSELWIQFVLQMGHYIGAH